MSEKKETNNTEPSNDSDKSDAPLASESSIDAPVEINYQDKYIELQKIHDITLSKLALINKNYLDLQTKFGIAVNNIRILEDRAVEIRTSYERDKSKSYFKSASKVVSCMTSIHNALLVLNANASGYSGSDGAVKALLNSSEIFLSLISNAMKSIDVSVISPQPLERFDSQYHNILNVTKASSSDDVNRIASVVAVGYVFNDGNISMLIQPAHVLVYI